MEESSKVIVGVIGAAFGFLVLFALVRALVSHLRSRRESNYARQIKSLQETLDKCELDLENRERECDRQDLQLKEKEQEIANRIADVENKSSLLSFPPTAPLIVATRNASSLNADKRSSGLVVAKGLLCGLVVKHDESPSFASPLSSYERLRREVGARLEELERREAAWSNRMDGLEARVIALLERQEPGNKGSSAFSLNSHRP